MSGKPPTTAIESGVQCCTDRPTVPNKLGDGGGGAGSGGGARGWKAANGRAAGGGGAGGMGGLGGFDGAVPSARSASSMREMQAAVGWEAKCRAPASDASARPTDSGENEVCHNFFNRWGTNNDWGVSGFIKRPDAYALQKQQQHNENDVPQVVVVVIIAKVLRNN